MAHALVRLAASAALLCCSGALGCASPEAERGFLVRDLPAPPERVLAEAERLLRREFGSVNADSARRQIESRPQTYTATRDTGAATDFYGGRSTLRQIAYFRASPRGTATAARLRIDVERQDTRRREAVVTGRAESLTDAPATTPIERDAATTSEQNEVWTFVRRNRQLELALLAELQDTLTPAPETP